MKFLPVVFWCALVANAAEVKISELPETNAPSASAVIPIVDAGANWKVQKANLLGTLTNWAKLSTNSLGGNSIWTDGVSNSVVLANSTNYVMLTRGLIVGTNTLATWGDPTSTLGIPLNCAFNNALGDPAFMQVNLQMSDAGDFSNSSSMNFNLGSHTASLILSEDTMGGGPAITLRVDHTSGSTFSWLDVNNAGNGSISCYGASQGNSAVAMFGSSASESSGDLLEIHNNFTNKFTVDWAGVAKANGGLSSLATDAFLTFTATGLTNSLGKTGVARFDGTTLTYVVKNNANTPVYTNTVSVGHATEIVQAGGAIVITAGSASGTMSPF